MSNTHTDSKFAKLASAFLQDMIGYAAPLIADSTSIPTEQAEKLAYDLACSMAQYWGGSVLYVPMAISDPDKVNKRNLTIWQDFTGDNQHALARKYNLSTIYIYQILADVKKSLPKSQEDLFDDE